MGQGANDKWHEKNLFTECLPYLGLDWQEQPSGNPGLWCHGESLVYWRLTVCREGWGKGIFKQDALAHGIPWHIPMDADDAGWYHCKDLIIFERSWCLEDVSEDWKKENITPIFIKDKKEGLWEYELVNLTSVLAKETAKPPASHFQEMKGKRVTGSSLQGFITKKSCLTNLMIFYN